MKEYNKQNLVGQKFNEILVIKKLKKRDASNKTIRYLCLCDCGKYFVTRGTNISKNRTKSCGHLVKHQGGLYKLPEFGIWSKMHDRCYNPNSPLYKNYGAKGIIICDSWHRNITKGAFINFIKDMGRRPQKDYSIERIDLLKGYEPNNCIWIPISEQPRNQSNNKLDWDKVAQVRIAYINGITIKSLAHQYNCTEQTIYFCLTLKTWY